MLNLGPHVILSGWLLQSWPRLNWWIWPHPPLPSLLGSWILRITAASSYILHPPPLQPGNKAETQHTHPTYWVTACFATSMYTVILSPPISYTSLQPPKSIPWMPPQWYPKKTQLCILFWTHSRRSHWESQIDSGSVLFWIITVYLTVHRLINLSLSFKSPCHLLIQSTLS